MTVSFHSPSSSIMHPSEVREPWSAHGHLGDLAEKNSSWRYTWCAFRGMFVFISTCSSVMVSRPTVRMASTALSASSPSAPTWRCRGDIVLWTWHQHHSAQHQNYPGKGEKTRIKRWKLVHGKILPTLTALIRKKLD